MAAESLLRIVMGILLKNLEYHQKLINILLLQSGGFYSWTSFRYVYVPNSVTSIAYWAFSCWDKLEKVYIEKGSSLNKNSPNFSDWIDTRSKDLQIDDYIVFE